MVLPLKQLDSELQGYLNAVRSELLVSPSTWRELILPGVIERMNEIKDVALEHGESHNKGIDLKAQIAISNDDVIRSLRDQFVKNPPFTVVRLAELLCDPPGNGYDLQTNVSVLKFYNSVTKLVGVCSHMKGSVRASISDEKLAILVEIPWLKKDNDEVVNLANGEGQAPDAESDDSTTSVDTNNTEDDLKGSDRADENEQERSSESSNGKTEPISSEIDEPTENSPQTKENDSGSISDDSDEQNSYGSDNLLVSLPEMGLASHKLERKLDSYSLSRKMKMRKVSRMDEETLVR